MQAHKCMTLLFERSPDIKGIKTVPHRIVRLFLYLNVALISKGLRRRQQNTLLIFIFERSPDIKGIKTLSAHNRPM